MANLKEERTENTMEQKFGDIQEGELKMKYNSRLIREHTVAAGDGICDYWTVGDKINNPQ